MKEQLIHVFTDGSCHTQLKIGGWAAIIHIDDKKIMLEGTVKDTSHQSMELMAVVNAIDHINRHHLEFDKIIVYSDSQYVVNLSERREKLKKNNYLTKKGVSIQNAELVQRLIQLIETNAIDFVKVIAHQKQTDIINYNREVDKMARKLVREEVKKLH